MISTSHSAIGLRTLRRTRLRPSTTLIRLIENKSAGIDRVGKDVVRGQPPHNALSLALARLDRFVQAAKQANGERAVRLKHDDEWDNAVFEAPPHHHDFYFRAVRLLLGHSSIEGTGRYLSIEVDDAIEIAEKIDI